jgi:hypothetical protein
MRGIAIRVGIIAAIAIGAFVLRPFFSGNAGDLSVGDCFDLPTSTTETIKDVQHHPCTDPHDAEVVFVGSYTNASDDTYPSDAEFSQFFADTCLPAYSTYTGTDVLATDGADMNYFTPTADSWKSGEHKITCYANNLDKSKLTKSLKKT